MSTEQGNNVPDYEQNGPYGGMGREIGSFAFHMLSALEARGEDMPYASDETPRWGESDRKTFEYLHEFDTGIAFMKPADEVGAPELGDLFRNFRRFSSALPFSEGERHWLFAAYRSFSPLGIELEEGIVTTETTIVSAGLRQPLHGRDLVRRWAAWRREADEFAAQGSLTEANVALRFIGEQLVPKARWPAGYVGLIG
jgi:hypothetical protein